MPEDIHNTPPQRLASLLSTVTSDAPDWAPQDLRAMLEHQFAARLAFDLEPLVGPAEFATLLAASNPPVRTFGELLTHPAPPRRLLELTKDFAKQSLRDGGPLPPQIATALYYAAITAARLRLDLRLTSLPDDQLRQGLRWMRDEPWVGGAATELFRQGLDRVGDDSQR